LKAAKHSSVITGILVERKEKRGRTGGERIKIETERLMRLQILIREKKDSKEKKSMRRKWGGGKERGACPGSLSKKDKVHRMVKAKPRTSTGCVGRVGDGQKHC